MKVETDKEVLYTLQQNAKLAKYGMVIIDGKLTTVDINLKPKLERQNEKAVLPYYR